MNKRRKIKEIKKHINKGLKKRDYCIGVSTLEEIPNTFLKYQGYVPREGYKSLLVSYRGVKVILFDAGNSWYGFVKPTRKKSYRIEG